MLAETKMYDFLCEDLALTKGNNGESAQGDMFVFSASRDVLMEEIVSSLKSYFRLRGVVVSSPTADSCFVYLYRKVASVNGDSRRNMSEVIGAISAIQCENTITLLFHEDEDSLSYTD